MISLIDFVRLIERSYDEGVYYSVYINRGVALTTLLESIMTDLDSVDIWKVENRVRVKTIKPVYADIINVELDGVEVISNSDDSFYFKYTCLQDEGGKYNERKNNSKFKG